MADDATDHGAQVLFKEARWRRRRRWSVGVVLVTAVVVATALVAGVRGSGPPPAAKATSPASPPLTARWQQRNPGVGGLPAGAQINDVVRFRGHVLASGLYFPPCTSAGAPPCTPAEQALEPVVWSSAAAGKWATWDNGGVTLGTGTIQHLVVTPDGVLLFDSGQGTALWRSGDGVTFTRVDLPPDMAALSLTGVASGHGRTVAIFRNTFAGGPDKVYGESDTVWTSANGATWNRSPLGHAAVLDAVTTTYSGFLMGGWTKSTKRPTVWTSAEGAHWTATPLPGLVGAGGETTAVASIGRDMTAVVGVAGVGPGTYWWSTNGTTWTRTALAGGSSGTATNTVTTPAGLVAWDASYPGSATGMQLWSSPNGSRWNPVALRGAPTGSVLEGLYSDPGGALALVSLPSSPSANTRYQVWQVTFTRRGSTGR
jgi:hypothetical protein